MYQKLIIVGYLGRDPEMRFTASGTPVTTFSVASSRKYTAASGETVDETTWFRVSVFGNRAESCNKYLAKGRPVLVEGRLKPDPSTGGPRVYQRQDETMAASFEVIADQVRFLGKGEHSEDTEEEGAGGVDSIPF